MSKRQVVAGMLVAGSVLAMASPAMATAGILAVWPSRCGAWTSQTGGYAHCNGGAGKVQVIVRCSSGPSAYGPWVGIGHRSWAFCSSIGSGVSTSATYNIVSG